MYGVADQTLMQIPGGVRGVSATLSLMRQCAEQAKTSPEIRQLALDIVRYVPQHDDFAEVSALSNWVRDNIRYTRDIHNIETLHTPEKLLELQQGDCDDKACLLAALLMSIGYPVEFAVFSYNGAYYDHVAVAAMLPRLGETVILETTEPVEAGEVVPGFTKLTLEGAL
jgi:transglutaminase-like putative cysteine protease